LQKSITPKKAYISFRAKVHKESVDMLMRELGNLVAKGFDDITIMVSSPGGQVQPSLDFYDFARKLPIKLSTHAFGRVASAAVVIYCVGSERTAHSRTKFLIHGIRGNRPGYSIKDLENRIIPDMREQSAKIANIISAATRKPKPEIENDMKGERVLSAKTASEWGLVTSGIDDSPIKISGVPILTIGDDLFRRR